MSSLSHDFEKVDIGGGGSYFSSSFTTIYVELPDKYIKCLWKDVVGLSFEKEAKHLQSKFRAGLESCFNDLVELDKSINLEAFTYNDYEVNNKIEALTVK